MHLWKARLILILAPIITLILIISNPVHRKRIDMFLNQSVQLPADLRDSVLIFMQTSNEGSFYRPPYGEIAVYSFEKKEVTEITTNKYFEDSPSYSGVLGAIYFASKRPLDRNPDNDLGNPSKLYKIVLNQEIEMAAEKDIESALRFKNAEIYQPTIRDSVLFFIQAGPDGERILTGLNLLTNNILIECQVGINTSYKAFSSGVLLIDEQIRRGQSGKYTAIEYGSCEKSALDSTLAPYYIANVLSDNENLILYSTENGRTNVLRFNLETKMTEHWFSFSNQVLHEGIQTEVLLRHVLQKGLVIVANASNGTGFFQLNTVTGQTLNIGDSGYFIKDITNTFVL